MSGMPPQPIFIPMHLIGGIHAQVTIEEEHYDELVVTQHPVEQGAAITDHAFKNPAKLLVRAGWSRSQGPSDLSAPSGIYGKLLALQAGRQPFDVYTARRAYINMLMTSLEILTDRTTRHALMATIRMQEVILVSTSTVSTGPTGMSSSPSNQGNAGTTAQPQSMGSQTLGMPYLFNPNNLTPGQ